MAWRLFLLFLVSTFPACASLRAEHVIVYDTLPCIIPVKGFIYKTCDDFKVQIDGQSFVVPKDFHTDLASIPRIFWNILPPQQTDFVGPAIIHDYMYTTADVPRSYADDVLYWGILQQGAMWITANVIWVGVRLGGASHFGASDHDSN
ncbi:MAG: DUF1353 domain-containing protein [Pseudomonadota bacterium]